MHCCPNSGRNGVLEWGKRVKSLELPLGARSRSPNPREMLSKLWSGPLATRRRWRSSFRGHERVSLGLWATQSTQSPRVKGSDAVQVVLRETQFGQE